MPLLYTRINHLKRDSRDSGKDCFQRVFTLMIDQNRSQNNQYMWYTDDYRYAPIPEQKDPLIRAMIHAIRAWNKTEILLADINFKVYQATKSPPIWPPYRDSDSADVNFYTFKDVDEFPLTVPVSICPKSYPLTPKKIHVRVDGVSKPLKVWLLSLCSPEILHGPQGLKAQRRWFSRNGQIFHLLDLPRELRDAVYQQALGPEVYPLSTVSKNQIHALPSIQVARITLGLGGSPTTNLETKYRPFAVNRQVYDEALNAAWNLNRKCFFDPRIFNTVVQAHASNLSKYNWLCKLQLNFTNMAYFHFFGLTVHSDGLRLGNSKGAIISGLQNLVDLRIRFRSLDDGWNGSLWRGQELVQPLGGCQVTMVDWIMALGFPFVKHIKNVKLAGGVKNRSKAK
ncbi:hypothetical protein BDV96DRAFT_645436 [Lophiotrema nucula]|uniref:Uncharacterized protein n=1 Tax=Lophiotrema nucula TaxID=690887 RepID=A0A6A5Z9G0_9PLEO|nr:hypothetical protein BDV96DRAFT_645436 [Lophiotrema nucula]